MSENFEFKRRNYALRRALVVGLVVALAVGAGFLAKQLFEKGDAKRKNVVHQITLLKPPPPPPPPPKEEKPPEVKKEEVKVEEKPPEAPDQSEAKPAGEQLGLDADGAAGGDAFGLAARKGGQDITLGGGGDPRSRFGWYAMIVQRHFEQASAANRALHGRRYQATVKIWLSRDGRIERFEVLGSSGDSQIDAALRETLASIPPVREPPPAEMPQPLRMRVTSKG